MNKHITKYFSSFRAIQSVSTKRLH